MSDETYLDDFLRFVETRFFQYAAVTYPDMPIMTPNRQIKEPDNGLWFMLSVVHGGANVMNLGKARWERSTHILHISCIGPAEIGEREIGRRAEWAARLFSDLNFQIAPGHFLRCRAPSPRSLPQDGKYRVQFTVDMERDVKTG